MLLMVVLFLSRKENLTAVVLVKPVILVIQNWMIQVHKLKKTAREICF